MTNNNQTSCSCCGDQKTVLIFPCSGASNVGQIANHAGISLTKLGLGKMSCLAGVGGDIDGFVVASKDSDALLVIDGCQVKCALACFKRHGINPTVHLTLTELGFKKNILEDAKQEEVDKVVEIVKKQIIK